MNTTIAQKIEENQALLHMLLLGLLSIAAGAGAMMAMLNPSFGIGVMLVASFAFSLLGWLDEKFYNVSPSASNANLIFALGSVAFTAVVVMANFQRLFG